MTASAGDAQRRRIERDTVVVAGLLTLGAIGLWPGRLGRAAGVAGGLVLIAVSYLGIRAGVEAMWPVDAAGEGGGEASGAGRPRSRFGFVKFFTRHAILAASAYVMMARFEFDPMAMLAGVTTPVIAATIEFARIVRARSSGSHSRLS